MTILVAHTTDSVKVKGTELSQGHRRAQIAKPLAHGVEGVELSSAVQAWDKESDASNVSDGYYVTDGILCN